MRSLFRSYIFVNQLLPVGFVFGSRSIPFNMQLFFYLQDWRGMLPILEWHEVTYDHENSAFLIFLSKLWWHQPLFLFIVLYLLYIFLQYINSYIPSPRVHSCFLIALRSVENLHGLPSRDSKSGQPYSKPMHFYLSYAAPWLIFPTHGLHDPYLLPIVRFCNHQPIDNFI